MKLYLGYDILQLSKAKTIPLHYSDKEPKLSLSVSKSLYTAHKT